MKAELIPSSKPVGQIHENTCYYVFQELFGGSNIALPTLSPKHSKFKNRGRRSLSTVFFQNFPEKREKQLEGFYNYIKPRAD